MKNQTLRGRVISVFGTIGKFATSVGWSRRKASCIINGKAAHINDLRKHIDTEYAYHGVAAYPWSAGPTAGQTSLALWLQHVLELRTAVDKLCTVIGTENRSGRR